MNDTCFKYCLLYHFHKDEISHRAERITWYEKLTNADKVLRAAKKLILIESLFQLNLMILKWFVNKIQA